MKKRKRKSRSRSSREESTEGEVEVVDVYQVGCLVRMPCLQPHVLHSEVVLGITHP